MSNTFDILGIAGSLRRESYNRSAMRAATELVPPGARIDVFELDGIPGFNQDDEQQPPAQVVELKARIRAADALLFVTPEYNYSIPGVLKNAIDWASRPYGDNAWSGKPAAIMGASTGGIGTARAQYHLRALQGPRLPRVVDLADFLSAADAAMEPAGTHLLRLDHLAAVQGRHRRIGRAERCAAASVAAERQPEPIAP